MNTISKIGARASAEGWNAFEVKLALKAQIQLDLTAAIKEWENSHSCHEPVGDDEIVDALISERRGGAYMFSGNEVEPSKFQAWCSTNAPSKEGDVEGARAWVISAPVGEKVRRFHSVGNGATEEIFEKTTGGWVRTFYMGESQKPSEHNGPWLTKGTAGRVAKRIGAPLSTTFIQVFNEAVENLWK